MGRWLLAYASVTGFDRVADCVVRLQFRLDGFL